METRIRIVKLIHIAVQKGISQTRCLEKIRDIIQDIPDFNIREKARFYLACKKVAVQMYMQQGELYNKQIKEYSTRTGKIMEHCNARRRKLGLRDEMRSHRARQGVFYLCSSHIKPAEDHADWQGRIYVDRFWRATLKDDESTAQAVAAYIRNHDIRTVQWVCGAPVYMITRPYCRHYMIELDTDEVLGASLNKIKKDHPESVTGGIRANYRKKYYMFRRDIHEVLEMKAEAEFDKKLIKKQG